MVEMSATTVMKLRKMSGQGMMDCKNALVESNGDMDKAMDILRKKGLATLAKRAERETTEGAVVSKMNADGKVAVMATLCCETDFVAKSDDFIAAAKALEDYAMACDADSGAESVLETAIGGKKYKDIVTEAVSKTGEKTQVGDYAKFKVSDTGLIKIYVHFNKKVGAMVQFEASDAKTAASEELAQAASDIAMHITATNPLALDKSSVDAETIAKEKAIYASQIKGKPENIVEKIVEGKMNKFFAENCLLEQPFVKDDSKTVSAVVSEAAKKAGGQASIKKYVRFGVG